MRTIPEENVAGGHNRSVLLPGLRRARQRSGLTQRELSELAGVGKGTIWELETEQRGSYPRTLRRLAKALQTEISNLVKE
jgi:transcriptional regulator with XRE-family HTH domain